MTTRETIENYFTALQAKDGWEKHFSDVMTFTNYATPKKQVRGRDSFVESTAGFYGMIEAVELRELIVEGNKGCATTRYQLRPPVSEPFVADVAEVFTVSDGQIDTFSIYFDNTPFPG